MMKPVLIKSKKYIKRKLSMLIAVLLLFALSGETLAKGITGDDAFENLTWEEAFRITPTAGGIVQSICATDDYIITIENVADDPEQMDVVTAYYKNTEDPDGNPVAQYSVAMQTQDTHWEHGNGMTYNRKTNEIYVAPYTYVDEDNYGYIFVMDPDTLAMKDRIFITDEFTILGIAYDEENDRYIIQSNADGDYRFRIYDTNFEEVQDLGPADISPGSNSQDMEVIGDYIINSPMIPTFDQSYLNIYSIERNTKINSITMNIPMEGVQSVEPESVVQIAPGEILVPVNESFADGRQVVFYQTQIPYTFSIRTSAENGTITESTEAERGSDVTVNYTPDEDCAVSSILVDGEEQDIETFRNGYTFSNLQADHEVKVSFVNEKLAKQQEKERKAALRHMEKAVKKVAKGHVSVGHVILIIGIVIAALVLLLILFYLYMLRLKRERRRRRAQARARRRRALEEHERRNMIDSYRRDPKENSHQISERYSRRENDDYDGRSDEETDEIVERSVYSMEDLEKLMDVIREEENRGTRGGSKAAERKELEKQVVKISAFHEGWPDETEENLVGHWQDGEWVMSEVEEPGKDD